MGSERNGLVYKQKGKEVESMKSDWQGWKKAAASVPQYIDDKTEKAFEWKRSISTWLWSEVQRTRIAIALPLNTLKGLRYLQVKMYLRLWLLS